MSAAALIRAAQEGGSFPAMDRAAQRLARGLGDYLGSFGECEPAVKPAASQVRGYADWLATHGGAVLIPLRLGRKLSVQIAVPTPMLLGIVDFFYGGAGTVGAVRDELTSAEQRFADRFGAAVCALMGAAWSAIAPVKPELGAVTFAGQSAAICRSDDPVFVQHFTLADAPFAAGDICAVYPLGPLRAALDAALGTAGDDGSASAKETDADWSAH